MTAPPCLSRLAHDTPNPVNITTPSFRRLVPVPSHVNPRLLGAVRFPLHFTKGVFDRLNPLLAGVVSRLEPSRRHRLLVMIDERVADANRNLQDADPRLRLGASGVIQLAAPPIIVAGGEAAKNDISHALSVLQAHQRGRPRSPVVRRDRRRRRGARHGIVRRGDRAPRHSRRPHPTTVLAQADSGVGVKNSINLFGKKNFAGTFVPPFAVINDLDFLDTLETRDRIAGIVEAVKVALLKDARVLRRHRRQRRACGERQSHPSARHRAFR